jgi:RNA binding exosome subunit
VSVPVNLVREVEVSAFAHATEDVEKVEKAMRNILPEESRDIIFKRMPLTGYHGDPITVVTGKIRKKGATGVLRNVVRELSSLDQQRLLDESEERLDGGGNLYIRFDKQKAYLGRASLQENDPVRMKFRLRLPHGNDRAEYVRGVVNAIIVEEDSEE